MSRLASQTDLIPRKTYILAQREVPPTQLDSPRIIISRRHGHAGRRDACIIAPRHRVGDGRRTIRRVIYVVIGPVTVTVLGVFQLLGVKIRDGRDTLAAPGVPEATATLTSSVGRLPRTTV